MSCCKILSRNRQAILSGSFNRLSTASDQVLINILSFLDIGSISNLQLVNKNMRKKFISNLWKKLAIVDFHYVDQAKDRGKYHLVYKRLWLATEPGQIRLIAMAPEREKKLEKERIAKQRLKEKWRKAYNLCKTFITTIQLLVTIIAMILGFITYSPGCQEYFTNNLEDFCSSGAFYFFSGWIAVATCCWTIDLWISCLRGREALIPRTVSLPNKFVNACYGVVLILLSNAVEAVLGPHAFKDGVCIVTLYPGINLVYVIGGLSFFDFGREIVESCAEIWMYFSNKRSNNRKNPQDLETSLLAVY